jgi:hypothetical protein
MLPLTLKPAGLTASMDRIKKIESNIGDLLSKNNKRVIETQSACASSGDYVLYLEDYNLSNLLRIGDKVYDKIKELEEEVFFKFFNPLFADTLIYCCNYDNKDFKYVKHKFNMFFCSNKPLLLFGIKPFTLQQYYMLLSNIGYSY